MNTKSPPARFCIDAASHAGATSPASLQRNNHKVHQCKVHQFSTKSISLNALFRGVFYIPSAFSTESIGKDGNSIAITAPQRRSVVRKPTAPEVRHRHQTLRPLVTKQSAEWEEVGGNGGTIERNGAKIEGRSLTGGSAPASTSHSPNSSPASSPSSPACAIFVIKSTFFNIKSTLSNRNS